MKRPTIPLQIEGNAGDFDRFRVAILNWVYQVGLYFRSNVDYMPTPNRKAVSVAHTMLTDETVIGANTTSAAFTVTLPADPWVNFPYIIQDEGGSCGTNNLTLAANTGQTLSGVSTITSNYGRITAYADSAGNWYAA